MSNIPGLIFAHRIGVRSSYYIHNHTYFHAHIIALTIARDDDLVHSSECGYLQKHVQCINSPSNVDPHVPCVLVPLFARWEGWEVKEQIVSKVKYEKI